ncbi:MAG: hypothetical protein QGH83_14090, partial [Candidatus Pacebacteria bacterium]|nr:hypothetical protein [Candidatus Paceibacterota bacterium]
MTGLLSVAGSTPSEGFELKSVRGNVASNNYFSRSIAVAGNRKTWTYSVWIKINDPSTSVIPILYAHTGNSDTGHFEFGFEATGSQLRLGGWNYNYRVTSAMHRDPAAWYHIVFVMDTTAGTEADRARFYINGERVTSFATTATINQNHEFAWNDVATAYFGSKGAAPYFGCYYAESYFLDGIVAGPEYFGETNELTNQWQPKNPTDIKQAVTFGTNGFYLPFSNDALATSFTDSGTYSTFFTPTEDLTCQVLVVGGGGTSGTSGWTPGAGGAGGLVY